MRTGTMSCEREVLAKTDHRPWPLSEAPWLLFMRWKNLAFFHWPIPVDALRPLVPRQLEIDTFDGQAWIGIVPFQMKDVRFRFAPRIPNATNFPELNVRTYVRGNSRPGIWFFTFDASSWLAVRVAQLGLNLAYRHAQMSVQSSGDAIAYTSERVDRSVPPAEFAATYAPISAPRTAKAGTLEEWLIERYCFFGQFRSGDLYRIDVHHPPWPVQDAVAEIKRNTMLDPLGLQMPGDSPLLHFAHSLDVLAWAPVTENG